jgi:hypothetical protein
MFNIFTILKTLTIIVFQFLFVFVFKYNYGYQPYHLVTVRYSRHTGHDS